jgi:hypothetical protein
MALTNHLERSLVDALHSCPQLSTHLGLQGLACLATSSSTLRGTCHEVLAINALKLADRLLAETSNDQLSPQQKDAVVWLLHQAPTTAPDNSAKLFALPAVPLSIAKMLVAAGVRMTYEQLLAAANSMVAGLEVWVQTQQQQRVKSDIPVVAATICCGKKWVSSYRQHQQHRPYAWSSVCSTAFCKACINAAGELYSRGGWT